MHCDPTFNSNPNDLATPRSRSQTFTLPDAQPGNESEGWNHGQWKARVIIISATGCVVRVSVVIANRLVARL